MPRRLLLGWGSAADGQLGATSSEIQPSPRPFPGLSPSAPPTAVAAGLWASLIVTHNGSAVFTTAPPSPTDKTSLALIPGTAIPPEKSALPAVSAVAVGRDFALLLAASSVYSLGSGAYGQLGLGLGTVNVTFPSRVHALDGLRIVAIAAAEFHWLALDNAGRVFSCGKNSAGQLGLATTGKVHSPHYVATLWPHPVVAIATGDMHSTVLTASGVVLGFGSNKYGQLGQAAFRVQVSSFTPVVVPVPVGRGRGKAAMEYAESVIDGDVDMADVRGLADEEDCDVADETLTYIDIACGSSHTVALRSDWTIAAWGRGENGQLGTRATQTLYTPTTVSSPVRFVSVSAGDVHSAALTEDGIAYLWGDGSHGQIGNGDINDKLLPVAIQPPRINPQYLSPDGKEGDTQSGVEHPFRFVQLVCGGFHTLGLVTDDPNLLVFSARQSYEKRIPKCSVDDMLQPKAGLSRFGSAAVLLRTFVRSNVKQLAKNKLNIRGANDAYEAFLRLFGDDGMRVLGYAAARLRHEAQVAFGLVADDGRAMVFGAERYTDDAKEPVRMLTPRSNFLDDDNLFRSSVANSYECGYLMFLALMNPVYAIRERVPQLTEFAALLLRCEENGRESFLESVSRCPGELLVTRFVRPLQNVLTEELKRYGRVRQNAKYATKALALLYHGVCRASKRSKTRGLIIPRKEFYNETVSERVDLRRDYGRWAESYADPSLMYLPDLPPLPAAGQEDGKFSFCTYSFLLSAAAKFKILEMESHLTMNKESMRSVLSFGSLPMPIGPLGQMSTLRLPAEQIAHLQFLVLNVRRENIVSDAFVQVAEYAQHPRELHKPLKVIFDGEEGVDEGGVRKEFYQVLLEQILSPNYGMFEYDEESRFHWFRKDSLESEHSWTLIGIMFGLAAFNSILLDVQFPPVVYRKLQIALRNNLVVMRSEEGSHVEKEVYRADLDDVKETFPAIGNSLAHLLSYENDDVEDTFCLTFEISYRGLFGKVHTVELVPNGAKVPVTMKNRKEFVSLYIDHLINKSIEKAFYHFSVGFSLMLKGPFVHRLSADELETLLVGEKELDFEALREVAKYEGYSPDSQVIKHLWQVLLEYDVAMKRLFLSFVTGTDRAPIGGLRKLVLIIQRAEGDSNRLPTSHTCFNVLLLPEYATRAKLRDRLSTAIRNSKGFGLR